MDKLQKQNKIEFKLIEELSKRGISEEVGMSILYAVRPVIEDTINEKELEKIIQIAGNSAGWMFGLGNNGRLYQRIGNKWIEK